MKLTKRIGILIIAVAVIAAAIVGSVVAAGDAQKFTTWQAAFDHLTGRVADLEAKHSIVCSTLVDEYNVGHRASSTDTEQESHDLGIGKVEDYLDKATSGTHYETSWTRAGAEAEYKRCTPVSQTSNTPKPTSTTPAPSSTTTCTPDDYDRQEWGDYPAANADATPRWTLPADNVNSPGITQDHHVALKDAHVSGGCDWSEARKDTFSDDTGNLNPTTRSFNSSKGNRTPDQLTGIALRIIDTPVEKCAYATQHDAVKRKYGLTMTDSEQTTVTAWLALCSSER